MILSQRKYLINEKSDMAPALLYLNSQVIFKKVLWRKNEVVEIGGEMLNNIRNIENILTFVERNCKKVA